MAQRIPVNLTEQDKLDMLSGKPVKNVKFLTLEPAKVDTEIVYRPSSTRRTLKNENYAEEYRRKELEEFQYGTSHDRKPCMDTFSTSHGSTKLEELDGFSEFDSKPQIEMDIAEESDGEFKEVFQLYSRYPFKRSFDPKLSITGYKDQILEMIDKNQVSIIQGGTGCGKSTQVCQFILEEAMAKGRRCNVVVTQPRKIAAVSVARRVCSENGWAVGSICGYQVGLDREASTDTRILFCTVGVLLQRLILTKQLDVFTHIILDEVHDRSQETDFCLLVIRKLMRSSPSNVKVVLMSATPDIPLYCDYLKYKTSSGLVVEPSVVRMVGENFDVKELYLEDLFPEGELPKNDGDPRLATELMRMASKIIFSLTDEERKSGNSRKGSVLMFLPGFEEIEDMKSMLEPHAREHRLELRRLHSTIPTEEQVKVFMELPSNQRKVILATNIAESSITVTDVKYVIDFCLTKKMIFDPNGNYSCLRLQWASKSSCAQRKGRAGRVADGVVYRMVEYSTFQALKDFDTPEMLTSPLDRLVLESKLLDMGSPKEVLALALVPPDLRNIEKTVLLLKEMGALSPLLTHPHDGELTPVGRVMASLPVDTRLGKLVMLGFTVGLLEEAVVIAALHSVPSIFVHPSHLKLEAYHNKLKWSNHTQSDSMASFFAFRAWEHLKSVERFSSPGEELHWCRQHFLELKRLREVKVLYEELKRRLERDFTISVPMNHLPLDLQKEENQLLMKILLCGAFYPNYFTSNSIDEALASKGMGGHDHLRTIMVGGLPDGGGIFYKKALIDLFRACDPYGGNVKVYFDHTRAYIEFEGREASTAVCSALKMRMMRFPLEVDFDRSESALDEEEEDDAFPGGPRRVALPSPRTNSIIVRVTETVDCGHFWGSYGDRENVMRNMQMHRTIQEWIGRNLNAKLEVFEEGTYCIAPFKDEDGITMYYRARVLSRNLNNVKVFFLDFGNKANVNSINLFKIDPAFLHNPFQAMEFKLIELRPSPLLNPHDHRWSLEAVKTFLSIVNSYDSFCCEVYSVVDDVVRVRMFPASSPGEEVGAMLVARGFAERCEESCSSRENHELRARAPMEGRNPMDVYDEPESMNPLFFHGPRVDRSQSLEKAVKEKIAHKARQVKRMNLLKKVNLTGPVNLFEVKFNSLLDFAGLARVERSSINGVVVTRDSRPLAMVSASVGIDHRGNNLIIRESTILPGILGLLPIVTLIFAPLAEYRVDKYCMKYVGAICGLGYHGDSWNGESVFPENDIELTFDAAFTSEDAKTINDIRVSLNFMMGERMVGSNLTSMQANIRRKLFGLLHKRRRPIEPETFSHQKLWNRLPERYVIKTENAGTFFVPHLTVALRRDETEVGDDSDLHGGSKLPNLEQRKAHHDMLLKCTNQYDLEQVFHCLICSQTVVGTPRLSTHLSLASHKAALLDEDYN